MGARRKGRGLAKCAPALQPAWARARARVSARTRARWRSCASAGSAATPRAACRPCCSRSSSTMSLQMCCTPASGWRPTAAAAARGLSRRRARRAWRARRPHQRRHCRRLVLGALRPPELCTSFMHVVHTGHLSSTGAAVCAVVCSDARARDAHPPCASIAAAPSIFRASRTKPEQTLCRICAPGGLCAARGDVDGRDQP